MPSAVTASSRTMPAARTCFCTSARCNHQASIQTTSGKANGLVSMLKALVRERPGPAMFGGRAEGEGKIPALAILAIGTVSIEPAAAQTYDPAYPVCLHVYGRGANYYECRYICCLSA